MASLNADVFPAGESYRLVTTTTCSASGEGGGLLSGKTTDSLATSPLVAASQQPTQQKTQTPSSPSTTVSTSCPAAVQICLASAGNNSVAAESVGAKKATQSPTSPSSPKVINELSPKSGGTNQNSSSSSKAMRNNASSGGGAGKSEQLKQRKPAEDSTGSNPIHHIAASGSSPTPLSVGGGSVGGTTAVETGRRTSNVGPSATNNGNSSRNTTKPCCFCWCCCYRCTCLSSRNQEEELSKSKDITSRDSWSNDPEVTPSVEEIRCWGDSFDRLMKSPMGRAVFREFLKCEYSEENILFWLACEDLKKDNNPEVVEEKARLIYEDYISILSPKEVSLDSRVREIVNRNMVDPTPHTFDEAQLQIYTLMHRDSYPRFVNSAYYKKLAQLSSTSRKESSA
nr:EOG090X0IBZ [Ceriodaphnia reticulata]